MRVGRAYQTREVYIPEIVVDQCNIRDAILANGGVQTDEVAHTCVMANSPNTIDKVHESDSVYDYEGHAGGDFR